MSEPTRLEDLRRAVPDKWSTDFFGKPFPNYIPATTADLVAALRAEGYIVIGRDEAGNWPGWCYGFRPTAEWTLIDLLDSLASVGEGSDA